MSIARQKLTELRLIERRCGQPAARARLGFEAKASRTLAAGRLDVTQRLSPKRSRQRCRVRSVASQTAKANMPLSRDRQAGPSGSRRPAAPRCLSDGAEGQAELGGKLNRSCRWRRLRRCSDHRDAHRLRRQRTGAMIDSRR